GMARETHRVRASRRDFGDVDPAFRPRRRAGERPGQSEGDHARTTVPPALRLLRHGGERWDHGADRDRAGERRPLPTEDLTMMTQIDREKTLLHHLGDR